MVPKDHNKIVFYINNNIDWNQFNQLYHFDGMEKNIQNVDVIVCKLRPVLIRATNYKLKVVKENQQKKERIQER